MSEPRNVEDVEYMLTAEGDAKPMREVLRDRGAMYRKQPRALREEAFRVRAGMQALLLSCLCCYPLKKADTVSEHEEWCPAHGIFLNREESRRRTEQR